jgi:hypothetical protein
MNVRYGRFPFDFLIPGHKFMAKFPFGHIVPGHKLHGYGLSLSATSSRGTSSWRTSPSAISVPGHKFMANFPFGHLVPGGMRMANWPFPLLINGKPGTNSLVPGQKYMARFPFDHLIPGHKHHGQLPLRPHHPRSQAPGGLSRSAISCRVTSSWRSFPSGTSFRGTSSWRTSRSAIIVPGHRYMANWIWPHSKTAAT